MSSPPVYCRDRVTLFLVLYVYFVDHCLSSGPVSFGTLTASDPVVSSNCFYINNLTLFILIVQTKHFNLTKYSLNGSHSEYDFYENLNIVNKEY
jgi:hypothetical protein